MSNRSYVAGKKTFCVDGVEIRFAPWDEERYFYEWKGGAPNDPMLHTDNVDVFVKWKNEKNRESFYQRCFDKISDSKYTQFVEKFLSDVKYREQWLVSGENWIGVLNLQGEEKPAVHPKCAMAIKRIESTKDSKLRFQDFAKLKTYGQDSFSRKKIPELSEIVGATAVTAIKADSRMEDEKLYSAALKWCARGLSPNHAVRKVMTDKEISENSRGNYGR